MITLEVGKTYLTRRGLRCRIIYALQTDAPDSLVGILVCDGAEECWTYTPEGRFDSGPASSLDLIKLASS